MPHRSITGYHSLEGESAHDIGDTSSTHDIGDAFIILVRGRLKKGISFRWLWISWKLDGPGNSSSETGLTAASPVPARPQAQFETDNEAFFSSKQQTKQLLRKQFFRWLVTAFFIAAIFLTLKVYQSKHYMTGTQKAIYNALITGLSLGLGLNFFVSQCVQQGMANVPITK